MKLQELFQETQEMCSDECCGVPANECHCPPDCPHCSCNAPGGPGPKAEPIEEGVSEKEFDSLKKGDTVTIEFTSAMSQGKDTLKVTAKNVVGKARVEKVTLRSIKNPKGVKYFLYKRGNNVSFAQGDLATTIKSFKKEELEEGVNDPHIFKAVFMAGGPGAGKSYVARKLVGGTGLKTVNSDIAFKWLMDKANLRLDMPDDEKEERDQVRGRAKEITKNQEDLYMQGRLGLLIDGTGKDIQKISAINKKLKTFGYETKMIFVNTDLETSLVRNQERAEQGDRTVDPAIAKDAWSKVQNNMMAYQQEFGKRNFYVVDNSDGPETDERKKNFEAVWKDLHAFLDSAPTHSRAKAWMKQQKVSYTRPTKSDRDWKTASPQTFNLSRTVDKIKKATSAKSTVDRSDTSRFSG